MMTDSRFLLTTSINEGFGFSFLEAWSAGRALWGRLLPDICNDFIELGVDLAHLYPHLWIPIEWIDAQASKASWQSARKRSAQRYGMPIPRDRIEAEWLGITSGNRIDFGLLCERSQRAVIDRVMAGKKMASRDLIAFNPQLGRFGSAQVSRDLVKKNRDIVMEQFSLSGYSNRLIGIYEKVLSCPVKQRIDKGAPIFRIYDTLSIQPAEVERFSMDEKHACRLPIDVIFPYLKPLNPIPTRLQSKGGLKTADPLPVVRPVRHPADQRQR